MTVIQLELTFLMWNIYFIILCVAKLYNGTFPLSSNVLSIQRLINSSVLCPVCDCVSTPCGGGRVVDTQSEVPEPPSCQHARHLQPDPAPRGGGERGGGDGHPAAPAGQHGGLQWWGARLYEAVGSPASQDCLYR